MTDLIEREAEDYINKIDAMGGMIEAIENGYVQTEIQKAAYKFEKEMEAGKKIVVGINKFQSEEVEEPELLKIDMKIQEEQVKFLNKIRNERSSQKVDRTLSDLKKAVETDKNLIPFIIDAVKVYASVGEICNTLREVFGEYKEQVII